jgi:ABC-type Na+ efflux pump permease subunit
MRKTWTVIGIVLVVILVIGGVATSAHQAKQTGSIQIKSDDEAGYA